MASTSETRTWNAIATSTLQADQGDAVDNIIKSVPLLNYFKQTKAIKLEDGGERIKANLMYGKNDTVKSADPYDTLETAPQEGITAAFYTWKEVKGTLVISRKEKRQNSTKKQAFNLLTAKKEQLLLSFIEDVDVMLHGDGTGNGGKDIDGLLSAVPADPTAGTFGSIDRSAESWWRNQTDAAVGGFTANGIKVIRLLHRLSNQTYKGSQIDLWVFDGDVYDTFESLHTLSIQYPVTGKMSKGQFDLGIENFMWKGAQVISSPQLDAADGSKLGYGLNSKFIKFFVDKESNFVMLPAVTPSNQTISIAPMVLMAQLGILNARKLIALGGITA